MRFIEKTELGSNVLDRQNNHGRPTTKEEAIARWNDFGKKSVVRNKLLPQQQGLCAYTEFNINAFRATTASTLHGCHIEHIKPKSRFPENTFDYDNLVISVLDHLDLQRLKQDVFVDGSPEEDMSHRELFGGHAKGNEYDEVFISPLETDCQRYFRFFEESGEIVPASGLTEEALARAIRTIELLNLNHPYLKNQRRKRMAEVVEDIDQLETLDEQRSVVAAELLVDSEWELASFASAVQGLVSG